MNEITPPEASIGASCVSSPLRRGMLEIAYHFFATIAFVTLAAPGVRSWRTFIMVALAGLLADGLRHILSPECRVTPRQVWQDLDSGLVNTPDFVGNLSKWKKYCNRLALICLAYAVVLMLILRPGETTAVPSFFGLTAPTETYVSNISSIDRRAVAQLMEHGYTNRAQVLSFYYAMNLPLLLAYAAMAFSGYTYYSSLKQTSNMPCTRRSERRSIQTHWSAVFAVLLALSFYALISNVFISTTNRRSFGFVSNVAESNESPFWFSLGSCACSAFIFLSYQYVATARYIEFRRALGQWPRPPA